MKPYRLRLELPLLPKSLNKKLASNYWARNKENKAWDSLIHVSAGHLRPRSPLKKARVKLVRHFYRSLDFDNLIGSMKPVVDSLVSCGILSDDKWDVVGCWEVDQVFRAKDKGPMLLIEVTEVLEPEKP